MLPLSILSSPPLNFLLGSKSVKFGLDLRHLSSLSGPYFETKQRIATKISYFVQRWWNSVLPKSGAVWPTPLMSRVWKSIALKKKLTKLSITHPRIDRSGSNLVHSLTTWHPITHFNVKGVKCQGHSVTQWGQEFAKLSITQPNELIRFWGQKSIRAWSQ